MFEPLTIQQNLSSPFEFLPHGTNRDLIKNLKLYEAADMTKGIFRDVQFYLDDLIGTIERISRIELVANGVNNSREDDDDEETLSSDQVQSQYFRPRMEKDCATIHRDLYEASIALRDLRYDLSHGLVKDASDQRAIHDLDGYMLQYRDLYNEQIKPHFYTGARLLTPSLDIFRAGLDKQGLALRKIPEKHMEYLQDALREFLGLPNDNWAYKNFVYRNSERARRVVDENLKILFNLSKEYANEADLISLDLDSPEPLSHDGVINLEYLDKFHKHLAPYLTNGFRGLDIEKILSSDKLYKGLLESLVSKFYFSKAKGSGVDSKQVPELVKLILVLDQLKFKSFSNGDNYIDSKTSRHRFKDDFRVDSEEMNAFHKIYADCKAYAEKCTDGEPLELRSQNLINTHGLMSLYLDINEDTDKHGLHYTLTNPESSLSKFLENLDPDLNIFLNKNEELFLKIKEGFNLDKLLKLLYRNAYENGVSVIDTASLMVILTLCFSVED